MLYIYDSVLEQIKEDIGDKTPERGGALLGEPGKQIVSKFIYDSHAFTTSSTYSPSRKLNELVQKMEEDDGLEYKGIIHSHPGDFDHPSSQDVAELSTGLMLNGHMPFYLVPIVTMMTEKEVLESHELAINQMKISFYAGYPKDEKEEHKNVLSKFLREEVELKTMEVKKIPEGLLTRDLKVFCETRSGFHHPEVFIVDIETGPMLAGKMEVEDQFELLMLVDIDYPFGKPRFLLTYMDGSQEDLMPDWSKEAPFMEKLYQFILDRTTTNTEKLLSKEIPPIRVNISTKDSKKRRKKEFKEER